jgi:hypothetical protein
MGAGYETSTAMRLSGQRRPAGIPASETSGNAAFFIYLGEKAKAEDEHCTATCPRERRSQ